MLILITSLACAAALVFRTPIRSLIWAKQVVGAESAADQSAALTQLCNAGDAGRWGIESLLQSDDAVVRQFGVIVLQNVRSEWSRGRLFDLLRDANESTAELAALGLAIHGDVSVIPRIKELYLDGDDGIASAACVALERIGAVESRAALAKLAEAPAGTERRASLVDSLASVGGAEGGRGLLCLLNDHRAAHVQSRASRLLDRFSLLAGVNGLAPALGAGDDSRPASVDRGGTIAERAAAALARITGLTPPFSSSSEPRARDEAARVWSAWIESAERGP